MNKILALLILFFSTLACNKNYSEEIIGLYKIDKFVVLNKESNVDDYQYLDVKSNGFFTVLHSKTDTINQIRGKWSVLNSTENKGILVQFEYNGKIIKGTLKENIFYFIDSNDFHNGKYESILYIKSK